MIGVLSYKSGSSILNSLKFINVNIAQVAQAYYESPEQHYPAQLIDNGYKTLYENYPVSP